MRTWADDFNTYEEACRYYGAETPESAAEEAAYWAKVEREDLMDAMYAGVIQPALLWYVIDDEIPW